MTEAAQKVIDHARGDIGNREQPVGSNWGPRVRQYLAAAGLDFPAYWCAAFVTCIGKEALGAAWPVPPSADCDVFLDWARRRNVLFSTPQPGDIFLRLVGRNDANHTGFVASVEGGAVGTIEGNTNPGGSRNGYGVFARERSASTLVYVRWSSLVESLTTADWKVLIGSNASPVEAWGSARAEAPLRELLERLWPADEVTRRLGWDDGPEWDSQLVPLKWRLKDGSALVGVRDWATWQGLQIGVSDGTIRLTRGKVNL